MLCARDFVAGERFALIIPDQLFIAKIGPISQLTSKNLPAGAIINSLVRVPTSELRFFPGARSFAYHPEPTRSDVVVITGIEPAEFTPEIATQEARSGARMLGFGRTIYPSEVFRFLGPDFADPRTGEVDLLSTFRALIAAVPNYGVLLQGAPADVGTVAGYTRYQNSF